MPFVAERRVAALGCDGNSDAALSIASVTGKPVMFASNGEKITDFDLFHPDRMASGSSTWAT